MPSLVDLLEQVHDLARHEGVEVAGWLVGQEEGRVAGDGARDGDALLLAAGELRGHVLHARAQAHQIKRAADALAPVGRVHAPVAQRHVDVVEDVQVRDEVEALEDEADALVAQLRARIIGQLAHVGAIELVDARLEVLQQPRDVQEGGLAGAGGAGDGDELPAPSPPGEKSRSAYVSIRSVR